MPFYLGGALTTEQVYWALFKHLLMTVQCVMSFGNKTELDSLEDRNLKVAENITKITKITNITNRDCNPS